MSRNIKEAAHVVSVLSDGDVELYAKRDPDIFRDVASAYLRSINADHPLVRGWNAGHGHVYSRADGVKARCGGPTMCGDCARDLAIKAASERELNGDPGRPVPPHGSGP